MHCACYLGNLQVVKYLVQEEGCDLHHPATVSSQMHLHRVLHAHTLLLQDELILPIHCAIMCEVEADRMSVLKYLIEDIKIDPHKGNEVDMLVLL